MPIYLNGDDITLDQFYHVVFDNEKVQLTNKAKIRIRKSREVVEEIVKKGKVVYGVNTGFGKFEQIRINEDQIDRLQTNLVLSHAAGVGEPFSEEIVRAILMLKICSLARGFSGCRFEIVKTLENMLNQGVHPVIPCKGSVTASGDLAPLAHLALVLIGEGEAFYRRKRMPGKRAMAKAEISICQLKAKEGLAILNGTQAATGVGLLALKRAEYLTKVADIIGAMSTEALLATDTAFDDRIHKIRGIRGQEKSAENLRRLTASSEIIRSHIDCSRVQDAYSVRCMPQVHGAARETVRFVRETLKTEMNSVTDNPLIFTEKSEVLSGGNFHGEAIAMALDYLGIAVAELANISERRTAYLLDPNMNQMNPFLADEGGLNSGFMIAQVTAASLVSENKILAHPASVDSITTSANQEDHVSMGLISARKAVEIIENTEYVLAIEWLCAAQGIDYRAPLRPGQGTSVAHELIRNHISHDSQDRQISPDIETSYHLLKSELVKSVESKIENLN